MAKKDERNLNITIQNQNEERDHVVISFGSIFRHLKKYFAMWLAISIIGGLVVTAFSGVKTMLIKPTLSALVSFTFKGIEKGVDPAGNTFNVKENMKTPEVIQGALEELGLDLDNLESIRKGISVDGIIPEDAVERITAYKHVYETAASGNLAAAQAMLDVSYFPTTYKVYFDYSETGLSRSESVELFNAMLNNYRDYFYKTYGFNQALGTAVPAVDYTTYDYSEQIDMFDDTLTSIEKYLKNLASDDANNFRSNETGFTFNDLYRAAQTIESLDLDRISSLINVNCITKNKNASLAYCDYRIESLTRSTSSLKERLQTIEDSISKYEKDTILIFGNGTDGNDTSYSQASEEYDKLINQRVSTSTELAETKQKIEFYKSRKSALSSNKTASKSMTTDVEKQLEELGKKIEELVKTTETTSREYYQNVEFKNAYTVLVPAESSAKASISSIIRNALIPVLIVEFLILAIYLTVSFITALVSSNKRRLEVVEGEDDGEDGDLEDVIEELEEAAESKKTSEKKKK